MRLVYGPFFKSQLHICPCPFIAVAFGFPLMAAALAIYKKPAMLMGIGLVAASLSWLAVPFYNVPAFTTPFTTYPIAMPTVAIVLSSLTFAMTASLAGKRLAMSVPILAAVGALSSMLSSVAFIYIVVFLGAPILSITGLGEPLVYIATNGVIWAAMSAAVLPVGYIVGPRLQLDVSTFLDRKPWLQHMGPPAVFVLCWVAIIAGIASGLGL